MNRFKKVVFLSELLALDLDARLSGENKRRKDLALISITEPEAGYVDFQYEWLNILRLQFHDISKDYDGRVISSIGDKKQPDITLKAFTEQQAKYVINFLDHLDEEVDTIVVHCHAGISRSAAVAEFIRINYTDLEVLNRKVDCLNSHVLRTLLEVYHDKHTIS